MKLTLATTALLLAATVAGGNGAQAHGTICDGTVKVGKERTSIMSVKNKDWENCGFKTNSPLAERILRTCPDNSSCAIDTKTTQYSETPNVTFTITAINDVKQIDDVAQAEIKELPEGFRGVWIPYTNGRISEAEANAKHVTITAQQIFRSEYTCQITKLYKLQEKDTVLDIDSICTANGTVTERLYELLTLLKIDTKTEWLIMVNATHNTITTYEHPRETEEQVANEEPARQQRQLTPEKGEFNRSDIPNIAATSRGNEIRFNRDYKGRRFVDHLPFRQAHEKWFGGGYLVSFGGLSNGVDCDISDPVLLQRIVDWNVGRITLVSGLIKTTMLGDVELEHCELD